MTPPHKENFITTKDAKEISGYTPDYLARLARSKKISGKRIGHSWLIERESLTHFLDQQGDRKIGYARALALAREAEYRAHHSAIRQATKALTRQFSMPQQSAGGAGSVTSSLRSQALALSVALMVVVFGAFVARGAVVSQVARVAAGLAGEAASGFGVTFGKIPSRIAGRIEKTGDDMHARSARVTANIANASAEIAPPLLANVNLSPLQMAIDDQHASRITLVSNSPAHVSLAPVAPITIEDVQAGTLAAYAFVTTPSLAADALARAYVAFGVDAYATIGASFSAYRSLIERAGMETLALASVSRDALAATPRLVDRMNLAFGTAIIEATHAAIYANVMMAYGTAAAAPASAHATVALLGGAGDIVAGATARAPALVATLYLRATGAPVTLAPRMAQAVFGAEYMAAARFIALTGSVSENYFALVEGTGRLAYTGTAGALALSNAAVSRIAHVPSALENAHLGMLGKGAFAIDARSLLATALPPLSAGERAALATYETLNGFVRSTNNALAFLFASSPTIVMPDVPRKTRVVAVTHASRAAAPAPRILNSYPTYTTVVKGVSQTDLDLSLATLRTNILGTVAGMLQPVAAQGVTNMNSIQQVNMIQDLSNLIVRNGDFRGGTFSNGSLTGGVSVSATTGSFTNLTGGATALGSLTTSGTAALATTTVTGDLSVSGTLTPATISASNHITAPYFVATSTTATSTFAGSLAIDTNGFVYATSTKNVGIGVLSPAALLALKNATSTQPLLVASNAAGAEVYRITNAGFVGIGTTTPGYALGVEGSSSLGNRAIAGYFTATTSTASIFPYASSTALTVSGQADIGSLIVNGASSHVGLATFGNASTTLFSAYGPSYFGSTATSSFSSAGVLALASALSISSGGTGTTTQVTNGINYFDGTRITSGTALTYDGTKFTAPFASSTAFTASGIGYFGSLGGAVVSSLAANYVPKWNSGTFLNSLIYDNGTNVGIGTTSPSSTLSIQGNQYTSGTSFFGGALTATSTLTLTALGTPAGSLLATDATGKLIATSTVSVGNLALPKGNFLVGNDAGVAQATSSIFISSTGNVGIGTTSPYRTLSVSGSGVFTGGDILASTFTATSSISAASLSLTTALPVSSGGTGWANIQSGAIPYGNGSSALSTTTQGIGGYILSMSGGVPTWVATSSIQNLTTAFPLSISGMSLSWAGLATTSQSSSSNLFVSNGTNGMYGVATTSATLGLGLSGALTTVGTSQSLSIATSSLYSGTTGQFPYFSGTNTLTATSSIFLATSGNIGIGTTTPYGKLSIEGNFLSTPGIQVDANGAGTPTVVGLDIKNRGGTNAPQVQFDLENTAANLFEIFGKTGSNALSNKFTINLANGNVGIGTTNPSKPFVVDVTKNGDYAAYIRNNQGAGANYGLLVDGGGNSSDASFKVRDLTGTNSYFIVRGDGNVGIGTTGPSGKLHLYDGTAGGSTVEYIDTNDAGGGLATYSSTNALTNLADRFSVFSNGNTASGLDVRADGASADMRFYTGGFTSGYERVRITSTGNVGIGTTGPTGRLSLGLSGYATINEPALLVYDGGTIASGGNGYKAGFLIDKPSDNAFSMLAHNSIGFLTFGKFTNNNDSANETEWMRIDTNGNVGIGTTNPGTFKLQVAGSVGPDTTNSYNLGASGSNWGCLYYNSGSLGTCASDIRLKQNITALSFGSDPLGQLSGLQLHTFSFKSDPTNSLYNGLIAQEVLQTAPELVATTSDGYYTVKYGDVQWLTVAAIQQLAAAVRQIEPIARVLSVGPDVNAQCVVGDTRLRRRRRRADGSWEYDEVAIADVQEGDEVASLDERTGRVVYSRVNGLMDMGEQEVYELITKSGRRIRTTGNHPFLARERATKS